MVIQGHGRPLVLIPGIQGHWQWVQPAIKALARTYSVRTFSLEATDTVFERSAAQVDAMLNESGLQSTVLVGVSFGGVLAAHYAATRPGRVTSLVLVVAPGPHWVFTPLAQRSTRHPWLAAPTFLSGAVSRLAPEILSAFPTWPARLWFAARYASHLVRYPISPPRVGQWVRDWMSQDMVTTSRSIKAPTLLITGEPALDRVVPWSSTREYLDLIPGARHEVIARTGHIGLVAKPMEFARLVEAFVDAH